MSDQTKTTETTYPDELLSRWIKDKTPVTVYLINGVKLLGKLTSVSGVQLVLTRDNQSQVVFYHAISTIMPTSFGVKDAQPVKQ